MPKNLQLDSLDEKIAWELLRDGRISNVELAARVGASPSTTLTRLRALRENGVIESIHAQVNLPALGLHIKAIVAVRLKAQARGAIQSYAERVVRLPNVIDVFFLAGSVDFFIHLACASTDQLRNIVAGEISMHPAVLSTETHVVFDHLFAAQFMDHLIDYEHVRQHESD